MLTADRLLGYVARCGSDAAIRVEAYRGEPFGIGRVTVDLAAGRCRRAPTIASASPRPSDRLLYPVLEHRRQLGRIVRRFINIELPNRATFYFMFRGDEPLELTLHTPGPQQLTIVPEQDRDDFEDLARRLVGRGLRSLRTGAARFGVSDRRRQLSHGQLGPATRPPDARAGTRTVRAASGSAARGSRSSRRTKRTRR